jgi:MOSC domain-containing protein YiiM
VTDELCEECGFDGSRWTDGDVLSTLPIVAALWGEVIAGADPALLHTRAAEDQWSIGEYTDHVREVLFGMRFLAVTALTAPDSDLGPSPAAAFASDVRVVDVDAVLDAMAKEGGLLADELANAGTDRWNANVTVDGDVVDLQWIARHAVHDATHHLHDIGRIRARLGDGVRHAVGTVTALHRSNGGVPKQAIDVAEVGWSGVVGDSQNDRRHHGRPFQALCLWSADVIADLVAEGHPVFAGAAGENITVQGIDWASLRPGTIVRVGDVMAEISSYATPCAKNAAWFADREFTRMDQDLHPGWSRLYAWVSRPGDVRVGDEFVIEPDDAS